MANKITVFFLNTRTLLFTYIFLAVFASVQIFSIGSHAFKLPTYNFNNHDLANNDSVMRRSLGYSYTEYNNYLIFKNSYFHLLQGKNLYDIFPVEQWDLYKYSPTFALLMAPLANLPDLPGLIIWNVLNAVILLFAIRMLPFKQKVQCFILWFVALELLTSMQSCQSNALMAGLIIAAYACLQKGKTGWAALWLVAVTFIKVYGGIGFCLFLFYPGKLRFIAWSVLWTIIFAAMPLIVTPYTTLVWQYHNWAAMLAADQSTSYGISVLGWLHSWFGVMNGKMLITVIGALLFLLPFSRIRMYGNQAFRLMLLASMLIWVIIFNHKAESPTYIIAMVGAGIWYYCRPKSAWRIAVMLLMYVGTSLSVSDIFPAALKQGVFLPYVVKAVPSILLWCILSVELMTMKKADPIPVGYQ